MALVLGHHVPFGMADPVGEAVRIVAGHRYEREDVAVGDVQRHHRRRLVAAAARGVALQPGIDRGPQRRSADIGQGAQLAHQPAARSDLDPRLARPAAQPVFQHLFDAVLADLEAGRDKQGIAVLGLIFLAIWGADIADQVADRRAFGIEAREGRAAATRRAVRAAAG